MAQDEDLDIGIKKEIKLIMHTYACIPYHSDFITDDIAIMIALNVFWNILYAQISTVLILCTSRKKGTTNRREQTK